MADEDDKSGGKKKKKPKKKGGTLKTLFLSIIGLGCAVTLQMSFVLLLIGLLPSVLAHLIDNTKKRTKFHTVFACNLSGAVPFLAELVDEGNDKAVIKEMIGDPQTLFIIYMSAGFGFVMVQASPFIAAWLVKSLNRRKSGHIERVQDKLVEEWGGEIQFPELNIKA